MSNTICAIATPFAKSALGIVRLSGAEADEIATKVLTLSSGSSFDNVAPRTIVNATAHDENGNIIDYLTAIRYVAPASFTGEDCVEFFCHGSPLVLQSLMTALIAAGAHQAQPGEFTKRAFLNGKTDLVSAEAIMDLISAQSQSAASIALSHLAGRTGTHIALLRDEVIHLSAGIMAGMDFPDEEIDEQPDMKTPIMDLMKKVEKIRSTFSTGKALREGVPTVILGRPNVGKSTLMNLLTGAETSIVTEVPGTTRDVVEQKIVIADFTLNLSDTAGLRDTSDLAESIGVERALRRSENAQLLLCVFDASQPIQDEDYKVIKAAQGKNAIAIINKADLPSAFDVRPLSSEFSAIVTLSAKTGEGFDVLVSEITSSLGMNDIDLENTDIITNIRHFDSLCRATEALSGAFDAIELGFGAEIVSLELEICAKALGEITGQTVSEEIVERIFERFCLGK